MPYLFLTPVIISRVPAENLQYIDRVRERISTVKDEHLSKCQDQARI